MQLLLQRAAYMAEQGLSTLTKIWEATTKLSDEAIEAARTKALEVPLDIDKGLVTFAESRINLINSRELIADAVQNQKLVQLPLSVQTDLLALLDELVAHLTSIASGTDEIVLFVNKVEKLNVFLWQYGFYNLSGEVLGYTQKLNHLKTLEVETETLLQELRGAKAVRTAASNALARAKEAEASLKSVIEESTAIRKHLSEVSASVTAEQQAVGAALASVKQQNEDSARLLASITTVDGQAKAAGDQIVSLATLNQAKIEELNATILAGQKANKSILIDAETLAAKLSTESLSLTTTQQDVLSKTTLALETVGKDWQASAQTLLMSETQKLSTLTGDLQALELQIKDQIEKAVGFSLFGAFQRRQDSIVASKKFWQWSLFACVLSGVGLGIYFIIALSHMTPLEPSYKYFAKLALSLPVIYAISFCSIQYGKERRLEEEYAFKASISVSLNPYQELVGKLVDHADAAERAKYTDFIINSINSVFDSPTDKVYETEVKSSDSTSLEKLAKQLGSVLEPLVKIFGHK